MVGRRSRRSCRSNDPGERAERGRRVREPEPAILAGAEERSVIAGQGAVDGDGDGGAGDDDDHVPGVDTEVRHVTV